MPEFLANVLLQALTFGLGAVGVAISFRVLRYPDLTPDGSFMLGSAIFATVNAATGDWMIAAAYAAVAGALAGLCTAILSGVCGVGRLLSGILTTMIAYSITFRVMAGRPNLAVDTSLFSGFPILSGATGAVVVAALFTGGAAFLAWWLLRSELGLLLRTTGSNPRLVADLGRSPGAYTAIGLAFANGLVGFAAALVTAQQGFADANLGVGVVVTLIAALVLGEELTHRLPGVRHARIAPRIVGPLVGAAAYFAIYLLILRASIRGWLPIDVAPTDLKLVSAVLVIALLILRRRGRRDDDLFAL